MIYKLYVDTLKGDEPTDSKKVKEFKSIYAENGVEVVGVWQNKDKPNEFFFMTSYKDEGHYNDFVSKMKTHARYQELSKDMEEQRESIQVIDLLEAYPE